MEKSSIKSAYIEVLRIIAIYGVIFNHTGLYGFQLYTLQPIGSVKFVVYLIMAVICKFAIFLYLMISGSLLLGREESIMTIYKKRVSKMLILLLFWSVLYYFYMSYATKTDVSLSDFLKKIYSTSTSSHLWYLYAYIAFLISLPILRAIFNNIDTKVFAYFFFVGIVSYHVVPILEFYLLKDNITINNNINPSWITTWIIFYPAVGYWIDKRMDIYKLKNFIAPLWGLGICGIILSCYMTINSIDRGTEISNQLYLSKFSLWICMALFVSVKWFFVKSKISDKRLRIINNVGGATFGVYLVHIIFLWRPNLVTFLSKCGINCMICALIQCVYVYIISTVSVIVIKKVPILRKIVGG